MSTKMEIVQQIFEKKFSLAPELVTPEASLEGLGLDSLDAIEVLFDIEDQFQIRVPQERGQDSKGLQTVQDVVDLIERLVREQQPVQSAS